MAMVMVHHINRKLACTTSELLQDLMHIEEVHALHERPLCLLLQIERLQILVLYVGRLLLLVVSHLRHFSSRE